MKKYTFRFFYLSVLAWLLHHANREGNNHYFYVIKKRILEKYGVYFGFDVQFIEGKKCNSCHGSGTFKCDWKLPEICWSCCGSGWYKDPKWNTLQKVYFGKYTFHQPFVSTIRPPFGFLCRSTSPNINGYIIHKKSKYGSFALTVLFLIYEKGYLKRWWKNSGHGWRCHWFLPKNWIHNLIHLIKYGYNAIPIRRTRKSLFRLFHKSEFNQFETSDDLPF